MMLSRDGRQTLACMLRTKTPSFFFVRTVLHPGCQPAHSNSFFKNRRSCQPSTATSTALVARYAMMFIVPTLLVAVVTSIAIMSSASPPATGGGLGCCTVSRFVCVHCITTGKLSSRGLFLARAAVRRHISVTKSCREAGLGPWLSGGTCRTQGRRRHGRSGWRGGAGAGRSTPATR
jgi:hypothetical protein